MNLDAPDNMPRFRKSCGANVLGQPLWMGILDVSQRLLRCFINQKYYLDNETRASIFRIREWLKVFMLIFGSKSKWH